MVEPPEVNVTSDVMEIEWCPDVAAVKQELDIGLTVLQLPDVHFMPQPCKPEPDDTALLVEIETKRQTAPLQELFVSANKSLAQPTTMEWATDEMLRTQSWLYDEHMSRPANSRSASARAAYLAASSKQRINKRKRPRAANWDSDEKNLLKHIINDFIEFIENKAIDTTTNALKRSAWENVCKRFNERNRIARALSEIRVQWKCMKVEARRRKALHAARGAKPVPVPETQVIVDLNPEDFIQETTIVDSSAPVSEIPEEPPKESQKEEKDIHEVTTPAIEPDRVDINDLLDMPAPSKGSQRNVGWAAKLRKSPKYDFEIPRIRNPVALAALEEYKIKIKLMEETHAWARKEHDMKMNILELKLKNAELKKLLSEKELGLQSEK